ncbi:osmoprotectant transporter permease [Spirosoma koreense]
MSLFWILWAIDALIALIFFYFFFIGMADGSVSADNLGLWMLILTGLGTILGGGYWLHTHQYSGWGAALLALLAIPGVLYGLLMALMLLLNPRWN